ncbi:ExbD/TolR family protein [Deferrisoma sp.]
MEFRKKRRELVGLEITPLVDVVFLLLIFFMLSTTFVVSPGIRIDLPRARSEPVRQEVKDLRVKIDAEGTLYLGNRRASPEDLDARFAEVARANPDTLVIIEADEATRHLHVVDVMDRAKSAGLHRLAIATRPKR